MLYQFSPFFVAFLILACVSNTAEAMTPVTDQLPKMKCVKQINEYLLVAGVKGLETGGDYFYTPADREGVHFSTICGGKECDRLKLMEELSVVKKEKRVYQEEPQSLMLQEAVCRANKIRANPKLSASERICKYSDEQLVALKQNGAKLDELVKREREIESAIGNMGRRGFWAELYDNGISLKFDGPGFVPADDKEREIYSRLKHVTLDPKTCQFTGGVSTIHDVLGCGLEPVRKKICDRASAARILRPAETSINTDGVRE